MLADCIDSAIDQVDHVLIVDNGSQPAVDTSHYGKRVYTYRYDSDPPNISQLWNVGIGKADGAAWIHKAQRWDVVVLNDDVIVPPDWVETLSTAMRSTTAVLAYPDQCGGREQVLHTVAEPVDLRQRITGYAYMLRGEAGLRLDESMAWHYSDDDLDWQAREAGGALLVPGIAVEHRAPNIQTNARPELAEQAGRDRETFAAKWNRTPH
jgi:GT2 family glycosyltransferase